MEALKLYGFNNLTKTLSFNIFDICYAVSKEDKDSYIQYINEQYNSKRLTAILLEVTKIIGAHVLNIAKQDYEPQGASVNLLISEEEIPLYAIDPGNDATFKESKKVPEPKHIVGHLDKSHITVHTYPESHPDHGISTFRVDIDVSTCGEISPLKALNYLIECFDFDIVSLDYRVRGFTRDVHGIKRFIDHDIEAISDFISNKNKENYHIENQRFDHDNTFHTKMMIKNFELDNYLLESFEVDYTKQEQKHIRNLIQKEMLEIFNGKNYDD